MPKRYDSCAVGAIMKAVKKRDRLIITVFGGADGNPIADRKIDMITTIRVNEVTVTRIAGANDKTVISAIN